MQTKHLRATNYLLLWIFFIYFTSILTGGYKPHRKAEHIADPSMFEELIQQGKNAKRQAIEEHGIRPIEQKELPATDGMVEPKKKTRPNYTWRFEDGLVSVLLLQGRALRQFQDPLLESEARPKLLMEELHYTYSANLSKLSLIIFWLACILLCILALYKRHWFYRPMSAVVFLVSISVILYRLGSVRKIEIDNLRGITVWPQVFASLELGLVFAGAALLIARTLPSQGLGLSTDFMEHLRLAPAKISERTSDFFRTLWHVALLIFASLALSNLLLLPLYKSQLGLQGIFIFLILMLLLTLAAWYIRAYSMLAKDQGKGGSPLSGLAFLGYRFLKNTLFISTVIFIVALVFGLIVLLAVYNTEILQNLRLLPAEKSL